MYITYKQGVYRHDILGVFTTLELAEKAALLGALDEYDGYHSFTVATVRLDNPQATDAVEDLFYISSKDVVRASYEIGEEDKYDPRPISRKVCMYNMQGKVIKVLIEMTKELEVRKVK